ncbi:MAG: hypothetical protein ACR2QX_04400 [Woeseiaceae bacterium]
MSYSNNDDDTVEIPTLREQVLADDVEKTDGEPPPLDELNTLSAPEREWLVWFYSLSNDDKKVVETWAERGFSVNATNIEQIKQIVRIDRAPAPESGD